MHSGGTLPFPQNLVKDMTWNRMIKLSDSLNIVFEGHCGFPNDKKTDWNESHTNYFFESDKVEMGHISIIDVRETRGMWMMHVAAFARPEYAMPIFGYDVICGKKKVTGCFHDISPTAGSSNTAQTFAEVTEKFTAKRERELPEWAKQIFSPNIIAVGQPDETETDELVEIGNFMLLEWLQELSDTAPSKQYITAHETAKAKYCENQLKNDNSRNVMVALGIDEQYVKRFKRIQFPY